MDLSDIPQLSFFQEFEKELGVGPGFFSKLLKEDDWSFVIKLHALIEAAATNLLTEKLSDGRLRETISYLEMSGQRTGKLAFIKAMELLDSDCRRFIQTLSELRNQFVHDVQNVHLEIATFVSRLPADRLKGFHKAFKWGFSDASEVQIHPNDEHVDLTMLLKLIAVVLVNHSVFKVGIWTGAMIVLRNIYLVKATAQFQREAREISGEIRDLLAQLRKDGAEAN